MTKDICSEDSLFGTASPHRILLKLAPPVMLAQLIQALYNIVDSFFIGHYDDAALTALSVVFPVQLIIVALAVGTGVGVNTYMARKDAMGEPEEADRAAGVGVLLALCSWALFSVVAVLIMRPYAALSSGSARTVEYAVEYGNAVCVGSVFSFLEGIFSKVHQARGRMVRPMIAQVVGAALNVVLDPLLIFGVGPLPELGAAGAAYATVAGQFAAMLITAFGARLRLPPRERFFHYVRRIYFFGYSSIFMQALYTVYIVVLNIILAGFSDAAVTVLGLYYKMQSFFFIPLNGLQTCIVPVISYNYARSAYGRCRRTMELSWLVSALFMAVGIVSFTVFPSAVIRLFSDSAEVMKIGRIAFPIIGSSFVSAVFSLMTPTFFQAIGSGGKSLLLSLTRQIFCLVPSFFLFSRIGLNFAWIAFPFSETVTGAVGLVLYFGTVKKWKVAARAKE